MKREEQILKRLTEQEGGLFYDTALRAMREFAKKDLLPPAGGAEEFLKNRGWDDIENDMIPASIVVKQLQEYAAQQPTAEGAEEIRVEYSEESLGFFRSFIRARKELCAISPTETYSLEEAIRKAFDGFATLHAQKIADKMVEERLIHMTQRCSDLENMLWEIELAYKEMGQFIPARQAEAAIKNAEG